MVSISIINGFLRPIYPGSYFFSISGSIGLKPDQNITSIYVQINGEVFGQITGSKNTPFGGFSYQIAMQLNFWIAAFYRLDAPWRPWKHLKYFLPCYLKKILSDHILYVYSEWFFNNIYVLMGFLCIGLIIWTLIAFEGKIINV